MIDLKKIAETLDIKYEVVCEVGVFMPEQSHIKNLIPHCKKVIMIEAQKEHADAIKKAYKQYDYVNVYNVAIYNENKESVKLYCKNAAAFIDGVVSPELIIMNYEPNENDVFYVVARTFDNYDDGDIDILTVDIEGAEWYVIDKLISRPKLICLETHYKPPLYINPFMDNIDKWLIENKYEKYCSDVSDTIYIKKINNNGI